MLHMKQKISIFSKGFNNKDVGRKGENVSVEFLINKGFYIVCRNFQRKIGEVDIIATKNNIFHFFEVKSVTHETPFDYLNRNNTYLPEELVNYQKMLHMKHTILLFLSENNLLESNIQINVITITFYKSGHDPRINFIENISL